MDTNALIAIPAIDKKDNLSFKYFSGYAQFLLDNKLEVYTRTSLQLVHDADLPLMKLLSNLPAEELYKMSLESTRRFLTFIAGNKAVELINMSMQSWMSNNSTLIDREQVQMEDITKGSALRKATLLKFIPYYTTDIAVALKTIEEIDTFSSESETLSIKAIILLQQNLYKQAQSLAHLGNWKWDLKRQKLTWSDELFAIYELEVQPEFDSLSIAHFNHPGDVDYVANEIKKTIETGQPHDFFYRIILKSGKEKTLHSLGEVIKDKNNTPTHLVGTLQDVTKEKLVEKELLDNQNVIKAINERYHKMVEEVKDYAILVLNREGIIENWNEGAERIKGYKAEEIIGKSFRIFYTEKDRNDKLPEKLIDEAIRTGKANHEGWRIRKDGTRFWGNVVITALHNNNGDTIGFTKVTRDLTERKLAEDQLKTHAEQLEWKNKELEQTNKELESFTYIASHDLQEPLRKIQFLASQIIEKELGNLSPKGKDYFKRMEQSAKHMQKLIDNILDLSHTSNSNATFVITDLNKLLNEVVSNLKVVIDKSDAVIKADKLPELRIIPTQFFQLFQNLISNGIKYQAPGNKPIITITGGFIPATELGNEREIFSDTYFKLSIKDNGIGFDQKYAAKIFEMFQRLHNKDEYEGTGIGLAICKKIVLNHNGFITAESEKNNGSIFTIYIPC